MRVVVRKLQQRGIDSEGFGQFLHGVVCGIADALFEPEDGPTTNPGLTGQRRLVQASRFPRSLQCDVRHDGSIIRLSEWPVKDYFGPPMAQSQSLRVFSLEMRHD